MGDGIDYAPVPDDTRGPGEHFTWEETFPSDIARQKGICNDWRITEAHRLQEFKDRIEYAATVFEAVRSILGEGISVNSWYRSPALNAAVPGSALHSAHMEGLALDFTPSGNLVVRAGEIADGLEARGIKYDQIIYENSWIHIGCANGWDPVNRGPITQRQQRMSMHGGVYSFGFHP